MDYFEEETFAKFREEPYSVRADFFFQCEVMMFADDRLRVHYFHDMKKPFYGKFTNTSSAYVPQPEDDKLTLITIKKATTFT